MTSHSCPSAERWKAHLDGSLSQAEQTVLTSHLDGCPACQKTLETLAAGGDSLLEIARRVGEPLAHTEGKITPEAGSATTAETMHESSQRMDEGLDFLAPSSKAGSIGRLGHYEVQEVIGQGGFGVVLKAFDEKLHRVVAIKVLSPNVAASGTARQRFTREARAAAAVTHEHVVTIHAVEDDANPPYLVMQLVSGMSLQDKLDKQGPLGLKEILRIGLQTACGLAAAHKQGLVHRDIKPANILLENGVERVKITDFGLARAVDDASLTQSGVVAGTPMFMAPEQAEGLNVDARADLFSLGSVLYLMCTGRPPFRATTTLAVLKRVVEDLPRPIREINPEIPEWLCDIVTKLHAKKPEDRYPSARAVADVLEERLAELQFTGRAGGVNPQCAAQALGADAPRSPRKRWVATGLLAGGLAVLLAFHFWPRDEERLTPPDEKPPVVKKDDKDGWVQLFNGKDLTGWTLPPPSHPNWRIEDGMLVARGFGPLLSKRNNYKDFHFRIEAMIEKQGVGGQLFRAALGPAGPPGYRALFSTIDNDRPSGTLLTIPTGSITPSVLRLANEKIITPDTWFTQEVIAKGPHLEVKVNGRVVTVINDTGHTFGSVALDGDPQSVIRFRKIEIKELPPTPPTNTQPFVVLAKANRAETRHVTLADAIAVAQSGDVIEVRSNGLFVIEPILIGNKPLTIRAASGFHPVIAHSADDMHKNANMIFATHSLVLEGLELRYPSHASGYLLEARGPFLLANCCLLNENGTGVVAVRGSGEGHIINTLLVSRLHAAINQNSKWNCDVSVKNSILAANRDLIYFGMTEDPQNTSLRVSTSTLLGFQLLFTFANLQAISASKIPVLGAHTIHCTDSVFALDHELARIGWDSERGGPYQDDRTRVLVAKHLQWKVRSVLHSKINLFMQAYVHPEKTYPKLAGTYDEWRVFFGMKDTEEILANPMFDGGNLVKTAETGDITKLKPADFRLKKGSPGQGVLPGGKDLGADVDLVGPGEAYEKWKKTADYQEWRKKIDTQMASPAP